jgi:hypothetical protein
MDPFLTERRSRMKRFLCLLGFFALILCGIGADAEVKNPDTFVLADYRTVQTIDPATSYDVAGSMRIWNPCGSGICMRH